MWCLYTYCSGIPPDAGKVWDSASGLLSCSRLDIKLFTKVWDIRWHPSGGYEIYCLLHGEIYGRATTEDAIDTAMWLNECENGPMNRTRKSTDIMDKPIAWTESWCHGGESKGHNVAGWYEPTAWVRDTWTYVGKKLV